MPDLMPGGEAVVGPTAAVEEGGPGTYKCVKATWEDILAQFCSHWALVWDRHGRPDSDPERSRLGKVMENVVVALEVLAQFGTDLASNGGTKIPTPSSTDRTASVSH